MMWEQQLEIIKEKISKIFSERGESFSQAKAEELLNVSRNKWAAWKRGQRPSADDLEIISRKLGFSPVWLLLGEGEPTGGKPQTEPNPDFTHPADTLRELIAGDLHVSEAEFAAAGGISEQELQDILDRKTDIPAAAIRRWVNRYALNANFLVAQIGHPILTEDEFDEQGPLSWLRRKNGEDAYPEGIEPPKRAGRDETDAADLGPTAERVHRIEQAMLPAEEAAVIAAAINSLRARHGELARIAGVYGATAREGRSQPFPSLHEPASQYGGAGDDTGNN